MRGSQLSPKNVRPYSTTQQPLALFSLVQTSPSGSLHSPRVLRTSPAQQLPTLRAQCPTPAHAPPQALTADAADPPWLPTLSCHIRAITLGSRCPQSSAISCGHLPPLISRHLPASPRGSPLQPRQREPVGHRSITLSCVSVATLGSGMEAQPRHSTSEPCGYQVWLLRQAKPKLKRLMKSGP